MTRLCKSCGQSLAAPRNIERHRLFFALLTPALDNWPENHPFQPLSTEHLRAWLLVETGWCTTRDLEIGGPSKARAVQALRYFLSDGDGHRFFSMTAKGIRERRPRSIAFNKCREAEFRVILETASRLIESVIGISIEDLKREHAACETSIAYLRPTPSRS